MKIMNIVSLRPFISFVRIGIPVLAILFSSPFSYGNVRWLQNFYNFGAIKEVNGPVKGEAKFINEGTNPTYIRSVRPSCGCTDVAYTEDKIMPGDTAVVSFTYDPTGRPGKFEKTVRVVVGEDNELSSIKLYGTVIASDETLATIFPVTVGNLRLERDSVAIGDVRIGGTRHIFLNAYNQSQDTIVPGWIDTNPDIITDLNPRKIPPGESSTFSFTIHSDAQESFGPALRNVEIFSDERDAPKGKVKISINYTVDPSGMTAKELEKMAYAIVMPEMLDLGELSKSRSADFSFEIINDGKENLAIRKIMASNGAVSISSFPSTVKGKKREEIKGKLKASEMKPGPFRINVEILTDDLLHPVRTFRLVGEIK